MKVLSQMNSSFFDKMQTLLGLMAFEFWPFQTLLKFLYIHFIEITN